MYVADHEQITVRLRADSSLWPAHPHTTCQRHHAEDVSTTRCIGGCAFGPRALLPDATRGQRSKRHALGSKDAVDALGCLPRPVIAGTLVDEPRRAPDQRRRAPGAGTRGARLRGAPRHTVVVLRDQVRQLGKKMSIFLST